ncbi:MAG: twin-arginine translocation signal domain-containing protein, partial [Halomonas sp.]|nr:twin-arginine translocation signal domain-containing protein [Halomonas sp.]
MRLTPKTDTPRAGGLGISRRQFLKRSGATTGGLAAAGFMGAPMMQRAEAAGKTAWSDAPVETKRTVCSHCSVGCGVYAEVQEGVWTKQEPAFDHPINRGAHCAKGASLRQH